MVSLSIRPPDIFKKPNTRQVESSTLRVSRCSDGTRRGGIWLRREAPQADATRDQRRAEVVDLRGQIESEICDSYVDLQAAASQMELAKSNQQLAREMGNADQKLDDYLKVQ